MSNHIEISFPTSGGREAARYVSGDAVYAEALEHGRWIGLYWSASGQVQRENTTAGLPGLEPSSVHLSCAGATLSSSPHRRSCLSSSWGKMMSQDFLSSAAASWALGAAELGSISRGSPKSASTRPKAPVPRHAEIDNRLAHKICQQLAITPIR